MLPLPLTMINLGPPLDACRHVCLRLLLRSACARVKIAAECESGSSPIGIWILFSFILPLRTSIQPGTDGFRFT